jgi:DNA-binding CsgD family transcriptional regulator
MTYLDDVEPTEGRGENLDHSISLETLKQLLPWPMMVVDRSGLALHVSPDAGALLDAENGMELRAGRLRLTRAAADRQLRQELGMVRGPGGRDALRVPDARGRLRFALRLTDLSSKTCLVAILDLVGDCSLPYQMAARLFGLSRRETDLAFHFSRGLRVDEIASELGLSANTLRVHLRNVFTKTGCSSQIELARLLARTATLLSGTQGPSQTSSISDIGHGHWLQFAMRITGDGLD